MGILALGLFFMFVIPSWNWLGISLLITAAFMLPFYRTGYVIKIRRVCSSRKKYCFPVNARDKLLNIWKDSQTIWTSAHLTWAACFLNFTTKKTIQSNWGRYSIMKGMYIPLKANCQYSTMNT